MRLEVNQLLQWKDSPSDSEGPAIQRIINIDESGTAVWVINISEDEKKNKGETGKSCAEKKHRRNRAPQRKLYKELVDLLNIGEVSILTTDHLKPPLFTSEELGKPRFNKIKKIREQRYEIIEPLITGENRFRILDPHERARLIEERSKVKFAHGKSRVGKTYSRQYIYSLVQTYWTRGQTKNALIGGYLNCGGPGKKRVQKDENSPKLGRPSQVTKASGAITGVVLTAFWLNIIMAGALLFYNNEKVKDIQEAYRATLRHFFPLGKKINEQGEEEIQLPNFNTGEVFTPRQFEYHLRKLADDKNFEKLFNKRVGERKFNLRYRRIKDHSTRQAPYPGALYQIDATIADVYLVNRLSRRVIGRPVIVVVVDVFSRMIVGISIRPEREKWDVINLAIKNAIEDKVAFCAKYGIEIKPVDWPVIGLPDEICGDNGPMKGYNSDTLTDNFNIQVSNTPAFRPDWKGIVESIFRLMNIYIIRNLPGFVDPDLERGDRDVRLDAILDIEQFTKIIIKVVLYHNNHHFMSRYPLSTEMVKAGVKPIPREIFAFGRERLQGRARYRDAELIYAHLLPSHTAKVETRGIKFRGEYYTCERAEKEGWYFKAKIKGSWDVDIGVDPRVPGIIFLRMKDGSSIIPCHLMHLQDSRASKYDLAEIDEYFENKVIEDNQKRFEDIQARSNVEVFAQETVKEATKMLSKAREGKEKESKSSILRGLDENTKAEAKTMDEEHRQEVLNKFGLSSTSSEDEGMFSDAQDEANEEDIRRPRFSNVLSIQQRRSSNG